MPIYVFSHGDHQFESIKPLGTESVWCKICGEAEANRVPVFGVIPQIRGQWASEFYWQPDLRRNHDEAAGSYKEARELLSSEIQNGLNLNGEVI